MCFRVFWIFGDGIGWISIAFLRDCKFSRNFLKKILLISFFIYKIGNSAFWFLEERRKLFILDCWRRPKGFFSIQKWFCWLLVEKKFQTRIGFLWRGDFIKSNKIKKKKRKFNFQRINNFSLFVWNFGSRSTNSDREKRSQTGAINSRLVPVFYNKYNSKLIQKSLTWNSLL